MTAKRFTIDTEIYFVNMLMAMVGLVFIGVFPSILFQISVIALGGIGFLNLGLFLDSWK